MKTRMLMLWALIQPSRAAGRQQHAMQCNAVFDFERLQTHSHFLGLSDLPNSKLV